MRKTISVILTLGALSLLATGCQTIHYELRPPASDAGRQCVTQCAAIREACRGNEIRRSRMELDACEHRAEQSLRSCLAGANSKEKHKECERHKSSCWANEDTARCDDDHRTCFAQCGGTVTKIVK